MLLTYSSYEYSEATDYSVASHFVCISASNSAVDLVDVDKYILKTGR